MKKSNLRYLGFLGFIGLLGVVTENYGMFGFFGFFSFFGPAFKKQDELLQLNTGRAALVAFVASIIVVVTGIVVVSIYQTFLLATMFLSLTFAVQIVIFALSLMYFERNDT